MTNPYGHRGTKYTDNTFFQQDRIVAGPYQFVKSLDEKGWVLPGGCIVSYALLMNLIYNMGLTAREASVTVYRSGLGDY